MPYRGAAAPAKLQQEMTALAEGKLSTCNTSHFRSHQSKEMKANLSTDTHT